MSDIITAPCPCFSRLNVEDIKFNLVKLEKRHIGEAMMGGGGGSSSSKGGKGNGRNSHGGGGGSGRKKNSDNRTGAIIRDDVGKAKKFFSTCQRCVQRDVAQGAISAVTGGKSKSGGSSSKSSAKSGKKKNKGKGDDEAGEDGPAFPGGYICMTCGEPLCEAHARDHFHDHKPPQTGKKGKKTLGEHCVFLDLRNSNDFVTACHCHNCDIPCGSTASLDMLFMEEDAEERVGGYEVAASGHAIDHDLTMQEECNKIGCLIRMAAGGQLPNPEEVKTKRGHGKKGGSNKHSGETPEEREQRKRLKEGKVRMLSASNLMGLTNLGNTCFFNATIQCLLRLSRFATQMRSFYDKTDKLPGCLNIAFSSFANKYGNYKLAKNAISMQPKGLFSSVCRINCMFAEMGQQDAHELYSCIINGLCDEYELQGKRSDCPAATNLGGTTLTTITCHSCGAKSTKKDSFFEISAPLASISGGVPIEMCINDAFQPEVLKGDNAFACEKCCAAEFAAQKRRQELERLQRLAAVRESAAVNSSTLEVLQDDEVVSDSDSSSSDDDDEECGEESSEDEEEMMGDDVGSLSRGSATPTPPPHSTTVEEQQQPNSPTPTKQEPVPAAHEEEASPKVVMEPTLTTQPDTTKPSLSDQQQASPMPMKIRGLPLGAQIPDPFAPRARTPTPPPPPSTHQESASTGNGKDGTEPVRSTPDKAVPSPAPSDGSTMKPKTKLVEATMKTCVDTLSNAVVVHVKRFRLNMQLYRWEKNDARVNFSTILDGNMFCHPQQEPASTPARSNPPAARTATPPPPNAPASPHLPLLKEIFPDTPDRTISAVLHSCNDDVNVALDMLQAGVDSPPVDEQCEVVAGEDVKKAAQTPTTTNNYRLVGVVEHRGSCHGGHYVAFVLDAPSGNWFLCNDDTVTRVDWNEVRTAQAYLLFYEKVDTAVPTGVRR